MLSPHDKNLINEVKDRKNNIIYQRKLTNMFTIDISFRSSNNYTIDEVRLMINI